MNNDPAIIDVIGHRSCTKRQFLREKESGHQENQHRISFNFGHPKSSLKYGFEIQ